MELNGTYMIFNICANLRGKWYYSSFFIDDKYKGREVNLPKVTQLLSDGFKPRFIWFQNSKTFPLYQKTVEMKDIPASEVEGQIREIRLIPRSPKCGKHRNCENICLPITTLFWVSVLQCDLIFIWYQIIEDLKARKINILFHT